MADATPTERVLHGAMKSGPHTLPQLRLPQDYLYQPLFFQTDATRGAATPREAATHHSPVSYLDRALNFSAVTASEEEVVEEDGPHCSRDYSAQARGKGAADDTSPFSSAGKVAHVSTRATVLRQQHTMAKAREREAQAVHAAQLALSDFVTPEDDVDPRMLRPTRAMRLREAFVGRQKAAAASGVKDIFHPQLPTDLHFMPLRSPPAVRSRARTPASHDDDGRIATSPLRQTRAVQLRGAATEQRLRALAAAERERAAEAVRPHTPAITDIHTANGRAATTAPHGTVTSVNERGTTRTSTLRQQYVKEQQTVLAQAAATEAAIRQALLQPTVRATTPRRPRLTRSAQMRELYGTAQRRRRESAEVVARQKGWSDATVAAVPCVQSLRHMRSRTQSSSRATSLPSPMQQHQRRRRRGASGSPECRTPHETARQNEAHVQSKRPPSLQPGALAVNRAERSPSVRFARHDADTDYLAPHKAAGVEGATTRCSAVMPGMTRTVATTTDVQPLLDAASSTPLAAAAIAAMQSDQHDATPTAKQTPPLVSGTVEKERVDTKLDKVQAMAEVVVQRQPRAARLRSPVEPSTTVDVKSDTVASSGCSTRHDKAAQGQKKLQEQRRSSCTVARGVGQAQAQVLLSPTAALRVPEKGVVHARPAGSTDAATFTDSSRCNIHYCNASDSKVESVNVPAPGSDPSSTSPRTLSLHRTSVTANWHYCRPDANAASAAQVKEEAEKEEAVAGETHTTTLLGQYKRLRQAVLRWRCGFYYHAWVHAVQTQRARDCVMTLKATRSQIDTMVAVDATQPLCLSSPQRSPSLHNGRLLSPHRNDVSLVPHVMTGANYGNRAVAIVSQTSKVTKTMRPPSGVVVHTTTEVATAQAVSDPVHALISGAEARPPPARLRLQSPSSQSLAVVTPQSSRSASLSTSLTVALHRGVANESRAKVDAPRHTSLISPPPSELGHGLVGFAPLSQDPLACTTLPLLQEHPPSLDTSRLQLPRSNSNTTSNTNDGTTPSMCPCPAQPLPSPRPRRAVTGMDHSSTSPTTLSLSPATANAALTRRPASASSMEVVVVAVTAVEGTTRSARENDDARNDSNNSRTVAAEVVYVPVPAAEQTSYDEKVIAGKKSVPTKAVEAATLNQAEDMRTASQQARSARSPSSSSVTCVTAEAVVRPATTTMTREGSTIVPSTTVDSLCGFSHTSAATVPSEGFITALLAPQAEADTPQPARPPRVSPPPPSPQCEEESMAASPPLPSRGVAGWASADLSPCSYSSSSCLPSPSRGASMTAETMAAPRHATPPPQANVIDGSILTSPHRDISGTPQGYLTSMSATNLTTRQHPLQREQTAQERSPRDPPSLRGPPSSTASSANDGSDGEERERQLRRHAPTPNHQQCLLPPPPTSASSSSSPTSSSSFMSIAAGAVMTVEATTRPTTQIQPTQSPPVATVAFEEDMQSSNPCTPRHATPTRSPGHTTTTGTTLSTEDTSPEDFVILGRDVAARTVNTLCSTVPVDAATATGVLWRDLPVTGTELEATAVVPGRTTAIETGVQVTQLPFATTQNTNHAIGKAAQASRGDKTHDDALETHSNTMTRKCVSDMAAGQQQQSVVVPCTAPASPQQTEQLTSPSRARPASPYSPHTTDLAASTRTDNCLWSEPELPLQPRLHTLSSHGSLDEVHDAAGGVAGSEVVTPAIATSDEFVKR